MDIPKVLMTHRSPLSVLTINSIQARIAQAVHILSARIPTVSVFITIAL